MCDPLTSYHMFLRNTRGSGYPSGSYHSPHPYEMSMDRVMNNYNRWNRRLNPRWNFRWDNSRRRNVRTFPMRNWRNDHIARRTPIYSQMGGVGQQGVAGAGYVMPSEFRPVPGMR